MSDISAIFYDRKFIQGYISWENMHRLLRKYFCRMYQNNNMDTVRKVAL
jgi:hypothetical protein